MLKGTHLPVVITHTAAKQRESDLLYSKEAVEVGCKYR